MRPESQSLPQPLLRRWQEDTNINKYQITIVMRHTPTGRKAGQPDDVLESPVLLPASSVEQAKLTAELLFLEAVESLPILMAMSYKHDHYPPDIQATLVNDSAFTEPSFLNATDSTVEPEYRRAN